MMPGVGTKVVIASALGLVVGLGLAPGFGRPSSGADEAAKAKPAGPTAKAKAKKADAGPSAELAKRPKKVVTPPSLTPAGLDALVDAFLEKSRVPVASVTTDVEFVRRIYLDLDGKLPTPDQTRAFVATREKDKRAKLIEHLLAGRDYATNWARYWRDVIKYHATNDQARPAEYAGLEDWLAAALAANRPWDEVAHDLITASGRTDENGAAVFPLAHEAKEVELAGEVSRIFLGVQIQCAQCHDHPNDSWKRQQFHEFAAFFAGTRASRVNPKENPPVFQVVLQGKPRYKMPDLKEPQKSVPVAPKFFLASAAAKPLPDGLTAADRHELAASFVTGQDNPWFARAFVNRVWYVLMGDGFYNPVDDIGPERTAKAPDVLEALASQWQKGGYDVRWLFRTILNTRTYQREVRSTYSASSKTPFANVCPSRLRADQILDSLAQALDLPPDGPAGGGAAAKKDGLGAALKGVVKKKGGGGGPRNSFNALFGVDPSTPYDDVLGTIPQSLFLMNSPQVSRAIEARNGTVLGEILKATPNNLEALNALYLRVLARAPTPREVQTCGRYLDAVGNRKEAFEDILWGLINSTEFITRR